MSDGKQLDYEDESDVQRQVPQDSGSDLPVKEGAVFGVIAVVATYLTHLFLTMIASARMMPEVNTTGDSPVMTDLVGSWIAAGWSYLGMFGVGFEANGESIVLGNIPNNAAALTNTPFLFSGVILFAVTVGTVMAAGYGIARYTDADGPVEAAKAGITVVPPYLVFAALAAFVMTTTFSDYATVTSTLEAVPVLESDQFIDAQEQTVTSDIEVGPSTSDAILFAGIVFPAVFAIVGALITQGEDIIDAAIAKVDEQT